MLNYVADPCTDTILRFIRGGVPGNTVGETGSNYLAYFGHPKSTKPDLTKLSLTEIYQFQRSMLMRDPRSSAIGAYQFLGGTLRRLQSKYHLSDGTLFSTSLQDALAWDLLVGRGYKLWWQKHLSNEGFAHLLSCEWASLPDPQNDGKSHYDGDSVGNHASTSLEAVYKMLDHARALIHA